MAGAEAILGISLISLLMVRHLNACAISCLVQTKLILMVITLLRSIQMMMVILLMAPHICKQSSRLIIDSRLHATHL
jgi:hypothetical protein